MFKRLSKRVTRRAEEEELGLDAETKEVLGLNNTDSDESDTSDDSDDNSDDGELEDLPIVPHDYEVDSDPGEQSEVEGSRSQRTFEGEPPVSLKNVQQHPLYEEGRKKLCVVCPKKTLKLNNDSMDQEHLNSKDHKRRLQRFLDYTKMSKNLDGLGTKDPREIVQRLEDERKEPPAAEDKVSRKKIKAKEFRALRKEAHRARLARRKERADEETTPSKSKSKDVSAIVIDTKESTEKSTKSKKKERRPSTSSPADPLPEKKSKFQEKKMKLKATDTIQKTKASRTSKPSKATTSFKKPKGRYFDATIKSKTKKERSSSQAGLRVYE